MAIAADLREALTHAPLHVLGRMVDASNLTLLCQLGEDPAVRCIYKPVEGERPLWDFPEGQLARREVAMSVLADHLIPGVVPTTVWREEGPLGPGMCQQFIEGAQVSPYVAIIEGHVVPDGWRGVLQGHDGSGRDVYLVHRDEPRLRAIALLDALANNADRKGGHLLTDSQGTLYAIDHGVTFHAEPKLRTVLWGWAGEDLQASDLDLLHIARDHWDSRIRPQLSDYLSDTDIAATRERFESLLAGGVMPEPEPTWPAVPWPVM